MEIPLGELGAVTSLTVFTGPIYESAMTILSIYVGWSDKVRS